MKIIILLFTISLPVLAINELFWNDENRKLHLWKYNYSSEYQSSLYSESPNPKATKQVLTGRIIVVFFEQKSEEELQIFMIKHNLVLINKLKIGTTAYLFKTIGQFDGSLQIANGIYKEGKVKAAYPDWMYLINGDRQI